MKQIKPFICLLVTLLGLNGKSFAQSIDAPGNVSIWLFTDFIKSTSPYPYSLIGYKKDGIASDIRFQYENKKTLSFNSGPSFYISSLDSLEITPQLGVTLNSETFGANFSLTGYYLRNDRWEVYTQSLLTNWFNDDAFFFNWVEANFYFFPKKFKAGVAEQIYIPFQMNDGYKEVGLLAGYTFKETISLTGYVFSPLKSERRITVFLDIEL